MIELSVDAAGLSRMERSLTILYRDQIPFAMSRALNDCAKAAAADVNHSMSSVFDRPTKFTERAAIAPRAMAATKTHLQATVTLRPLQAEYLRLEETGGTRTGAMNTRKPSRTVLLPGKTLPLDEFGNIPRGQIAKFRAEAARAKKSRRRKGAPPSAVTVAFLPANAPGNKAGIAGWFRRLAGHGLARLTAFEAKTNYHAHMGYHARVNRVARATWPKALQVRLAEAIRTAR